MSDHFQSIVDRDATLDEALALADQIVGWLVERGIILPIPTDCTLGGTGHPPGPKFHNAVIPPYASRLGPDGERIRDDGTLLKLRTNGLEVSVGRTVFHAGGYGIGPICCGCGTRFETLDELSWDDAVEQWYHGRGDGLLACPRCGHTEPVTEWNHDPPFGFGNLGLTFWNWSRLKEEFVAEIGRRFGHRTLLVHGRL
jgi:hypothetical protein